MRSPDEKPVKLVRERLDAAGLAAHVRAIAARARSIEVRVQADTGRTSEVATDSLDELARRLAAGELVAVQIRFLEDETWWCDTLMRARDGFRLVRMREGA